MDLRWFIGVIPRVASSFNWLKQAQIVIYESAKQIKIFTGESYKGGGGGGGWGSINKRPGKNFLSLIQFIHDSLL